MDTIEAQRRHVSPLGRKFWTYEGIEPRDHTLAALTGMLMGVHALARVLANSDAFRGQLESSQEPPLKQLPLDVSITEGLFAALYFLSEHAQETAEELLGQPGAIPSSLQPRLIKPCSTPSVSLPADAEGTRITRTVRLPALSTTDWKVGIPSWGSKGAYTVSCQETP